MKLRTLSSDIWFLQMTVSKDNLNLDLLLGDKEPAKGVIGHQGVKVAYIDGRVAFLYSLATMCLPSARIISPFSTRVFKIQVTFVGALSASSTTRTWPNFTALTF